MTDILRFAWQSSACLALFYGLYYYFLRQETHFALNRFYLLASLLLAIAIPLSGIPSPFRIILLPTSAFSLEAATTTSGFTLDLEHIIFLLYLSGLAVFGLRLLAHIGKLLWLVHRYGRQYRYGTRVVFHDLNAPPFSFFSHVFLNRDRLGKHEMRHIFAHERVHRDQFHSLDILLMEAVTVFQWFNPFVWPYKRSIKELHEYLADQGVIAQGFSTTRYQSLLFEQQIGAKLFEFANNFKQSQIKRRITMMSRLKSGKSTQMKFFLIVPFALFLMIAFAEPRVVFEQSSDSPTGPVAAADEVKKTAGSSTSISKQEEEWKMLADKEAKITQMLKETSDPEERAKLKQTLEKIAMKKKELKSGGSTSADEATYLAEMEMKLKAKLENTTDPKAREELKMKLANTQKKREHLLASSSGTESGPVDKESLLKEFQKLSDVEAKLKEKISASTNEEEKSAWLQKLDEIQAKKKQLKKMASAGEG